VIGGAYEEERGEEREGDCRQVEKL